MPSLHAKDGKVPSNVTSTSSMPEVVIRRFAFKHELQLHQAQSIFAELESFLDEAANKASIPSILVDNAWHEFILHTREYMSYCNSRYGRFIHHIPTSPILYGEAAKPERCSTQAPHCKSNAEKGEGCTSDCRGGCKSN